MPNRLSRETSPYLLQHAHNPVDWYPWGDEAFGLARTSDRPILLSIGYSACHWCHVMERESFEDVDTAALMNELFVNVKVDREERPDVDHIYMQAVQSLTGSGGWPLTAFLTPDGEPFYGGTYFPPERRHGMPGFREVCRAVAEAYRDRRDQVVRTAAELRDLIERASERGSSPEETPDLPNAEEATRTIAGTFDPTHGGFGRAPKFPQPMVIDLLLQHHVRAGDAQALAMAAHTLRRMAAGGMRDHLGGGFHRYSVDERWLVPHFEKMLYDNAQLARSYLHAHLVTGDADLRATVESTLDYVLEDLTAPEGGFFSARDADSEGEEGRFYVWTAAEVDEILGADAPLFRRVYDVSAGGNFEGKNILHLPHDPSALARAEGVEEAELAEAMRRGRRLLVECRASREEPLRDEKVLTGWSALTIRAFAEAGSALDRDDYVQAATRAAGFLLGPMRPDGVLMHTFKDGRAHVPAQLRDFAELGNALLALYQADPDPRWLQEGLWTATQIVDRFWDPDRGLLFDTAHDGEQLIVRPRDLQDGAIPSGTASAAELLLHLGRLFGRDRDLAIVDRLLAAIPDAARFPLGFSKSIAVAALARTPSLEVVLVGDRARPAWRDLHRAVTGRSLPGLVFLAAETTEDGRTVLAGAQGLEAAGFPVDSPLLEGKTTVSDQPTAYVCWHHTCSPPVTEPAALRDLLAQAAQGGLDLPPARG